MDVKSIKKDILKKHTNNNNTTNFGIHEFKINNIYSIDIEYIILNNKVYINECCLLKLNKQCKYTSVYQQISKKYTNLGCLLKKTQDILKNIKVV